nr:hypothetical protein [Micromonospora sp. DSM 115978]
MVGHRRPGNRVWLAETPQLASWDRAGSPSQVRLARFLDHAEAAVASLLVGAGPFAVELAVGEPDGQTRYARGRDLDNYLFPLVTRLGPTRVTAAFGRKIRGRSWIGAGPAVPEPVAALPFTARIAGSYVKPEWKHELRNRLIATGVRPMPPGPLALWVGIGTSPGRNWANLWKPLIDALGPVLGEPPGRPFHPYDDRIVDLSLHHHTDPALGHDVQVGLWWAPGPVVITPS